MPNDVDRTRYIFKELMKHLRAEFAAIRSLNLGVLSGTNVGDALALTRLRQLAQELSLLAISSDLSSDELARMARKLSSSELASLQNLLDSQNMDELSDFIRLMVYNTGNLMAKEEVGKKPPASVLRPISDETTWLQPKIKSRPNTQRTMLPVRSPRRAAGKVDEDGIKFASLSPDSKLVKLAKELHLSRQPKAIQPEATQQPEPRDENEVLLEAAAPLYSSGLGESVGPPNLREMIRPPPPPPSSPPVWSDVERNWKDAMNQTSTKQSIPLLGTTYLQPQLKPKVAHVERQLKKEEEERALEEQRALSPPRANLRRGSVFISGNSNFGNPEGLMRASAASAALAAIPCTIRVTINE